MVGRIWRAHATYAQDIMPLTNTFQATLFRGALQYGSNAFHHWRRGSEKSINCSARSFTIARSDPYFQPGRLVQHLGINHCRVKSVAQKRQLFTRCFRRCRKRPTEI
jgi:hypothetical protein